MHASHLRTYFVQRNFVRTKSIHWEEVLVRSYNDPRTFRLDLVVVLSERNTLNGTYLEKWKLDAHRWLFLLRIGQSGFLYLEHCDFNWKIDFYVIKGICISRSHEAPKLGFRVLYTSSLLVNLVLSHDIFNVSGNWAWTWCPVRVLIWWIRKRCQSWNSITW